MLVILAGDMNTLPLNIPSEKTGLIPIVKNPTRGNNVLDQVMTSQPCFDKVKVFQSVVKTDNKAVLVHDSGFIINHATTRIHALIENVRLATCNISAIP